MIVIITGCPCVGKTTVCRELKSWGFETIKIDDFFEAGKSKYDPEHSERAYARLFEALGNQGDYVVDTPGNAPAFLEQRKRLVHYTTVQLDAPWETILHRYKQRWQADDISPWKLKEEFEDSKRLRADMRIDVQYISPEDAAKVIAQRLKMREHGGKDMHRDLFGQGNRPVRKSFLDHMMEGLDG